MRVIFAGGGTAGHINPALAIARHIKDIEQKCDILFIGTEKGLEKSLVPKEGFEIKFIKVKGFRRKISFDTVLTVAELTKGLYETIKIIREYKPDIVIGTGGYVCGPVVFVAHLMKIPTIVHEQNAFPGITIKILSKLADVVAISFEESKKYLKVKKRLVHTGNPVKKDILTITKESSRADLGLDKRPFLLAFGGSLGAQRINEVLVEYIKELVFKNKNNNSNIQLMFATGEREYENVLDALSKAGIHIDACENIKVVPYIHNMDKAISAADLVICRAGAITLAEITAKGVPAVLIPSPNVTNNHQEYNSRVLQSKKAAIVLLERELCVERLSGEIDKLLSDKRLLKNMALNSYNMGIRDATEKIYEEVTLLLGR